MKQAKKRAEKIYLGQRKGDGCPVLEMGDFWSHIREILYSYETDTRLGSVGIYKRLKEDLQLHL